MPPRTPILFTYTDFVYGGPFSLSPISFPQNSHSEIPFQSNQYGPHELTITIFGNNWTIERYHSQERVLLTEEEKELELRYKDSLIYGVGHGVPVVWGMNSQQQMEIRSDFRPSVEVPQATADTGSVDSKALGFAFLNKYDKQRKIF